MAKRLVTGQAGFIGSYVANLFLSEEYEVLILDDLFTGPLSNLYSDAEFYLC